ncbi:hypothetical protein A3Q56_05723 [Intoshia linei]|uniref:Uncharacterized protein n=1 Tax=Intoshia linei TaxID=1819745 RepID=A0A177AWZ3_9BILA|nr:hypothetical protein A3Q56_05723 [Intoshia linei]
MTPTEIVEFYNIIGLFHEGKYTSEMIEEIKRNGFSTNTSIENVETLADSKISITSRRAKKWLSMLKTWSTLDTFLKLKYRIFKDIPISMRS